MCAVYGICEPFTNIPQKIDLDAIAKETQRTFSTERQEHPELEPKDFINIVDPYFVMPKFTRQLDHLKPNLSVHKNRYMNLKWKKFLDNVPDRYVNIQLAKDIPKPPKRVRRMALNGQFYGVDYKLAPIPVADDPRNYSKDKNKSKDKPKLETTDNSQIVRTPDNNKINKSNS